MPMKWRQLNYLPLFSKLTYIHSENMHGRLLKAILQQTLQSLFYSTCPTILLPLFLISSHINGHLKIKMLLEKGIFGTWAPSADIFDRTSHQLLPAVHSTLLLVLLAVTFLSPVFCYFSRTLTCNLHSTLIN